MNTKTPAWRLLEETADEDRNSVCGEHYRADYSEHDLNMEQASVDLAQAVRCFGRPARPSPRAGSPTRPSAHSDYWARPRLPSCASPAPVRCDHVGARSSARGALAPCSCAPAGLACVRTPMQARGSSTSRGIAALLAPGAGQRRRPRSGVDVRRGPPRPRVPNSSAHPGGHLRQLMSLRRGARRYTRRTITRSVRFLCDVPHADDGN